VPGAQPSTAPVGRATPFATLRVACSFRFLTGAALILDCFPS
jgi:hypothetical protein